jgi:GNAT superfamily N-acetyltransferase
MNTKELELQVIKLTAKEKDIKQICHDGILFKMTDEEIFVFGLDIKNEEHANQVIKDVEDYCEKIGVEKFEFAIIHPKSQSDTFLENALKQKYKFRDDFVCARMFYENSTLPQYEFPPDFQLKKESCSSPLYKSIFKKCFSDGVNKIEGEELKALLKTFDENAKEQDNSFILYHQDEPVGLISLISKNGKSTVGDVGVIPQYRKKGLGGQMLDFIINKHFEKNDGFLCLATSEDKEGKDFIKFYERHGFIKKYTIHDWKKD